MFDPIQHLTQCLDELEKRRAREIEEQAGWTFEDGTPTVTADLADIDYIVSVYSQVLDQLQTRQPAF